MREVKIDFYKALHYWAIFPYLLIGYHKSQGVSSIGTIKLQIQFGWLIFHGQIYTVHN